jgi:hypothetical protein
LALAVFCWPALAQLPEAVAQSEPQGYRELVQDAVNEFAVHNFEEARVLFSRAHALMPSARTHRGLGMVEFELRNYRESIVHLEEALRSQVKPLDGERRTETERLLARANDFVGRLVLKLQPSAASVSIDGTPLDVSADEGVVLGLGEHILVVEADGYAPHKQTLSIAGGDLQTLKVVLVKTLVSAPPGLAATQRVAAPAKPRRWYKSPWLWTTLGVVVLGAAAGTTYALVRSDSETAPPYGGTANAVIEAP